MARRILLADDSVTAQNMGRRILTDAGYEVVTVNNGSAALKKIAENKPDLIVLDVYMPGYGGLEVCQRVKENPETKQIPVLLTVGKLEPFKAEEARRVGADAFIIKPFEATELLTVLTKLEDKIVAQPQPQKSGRFAKALAAVEQSDTRQQFGDKETGWKNRLTIPSPNAKPRLEEEAPEAIAATPRGPAQIEAVRPVEPAQGFERPMPAGLPVDITPEEIAAITSAAASFGGNREQPPAIPETAAVVTQEVATTEAATVQSIAAEVPPATLASAPEASQPVQAEAPAEAVHVQVEDAKGEDSQIEDRQAEDRSSGAELPVAVASLETTSSSETQISQPAAGDDEVMAAIASLAPTSGHAIESTQPGASGSNGAGHEVATSSAVSETASGPRWIAEPVTVASEESKLALDQEMEQVHAARTSAEAATLSAAAVTDAVSSSLVAVAESAEPSIAPAIAAEATVAEFAAIESAPAVKSNDASVVESEAVESVAAFEAVASPIVEASPVQDQEPAPVAAESAYAAAASAGAVAARNAPVEAVSAASIVPENSATAPAESSPPREAELAAAWQNWKQIRESFVGAQPPAVTSELPNELTSNREEAAIPVQSASADVVAEPAEAEEAASDAPEESTAIASIVDNMLAELRPKLVEEIAKKMSSDKKEKEKDKKKKK